LERYKDKEISISYARLQVFTVVIALVLGKSLLWESEYVAIGKL
jgi:hypothetical protein